MVLGKNRPSLGIELGSAPYLLLGKPRRNGY